MVELRTPDERSCLRCGRREVWDEDAGAWQVGGDEVGDVYCIHDWDVTGEFTPVAKP
ncbi:HEWD family protein [Salarchaeum sp. III]|uniref:HEWD family protein n=1 Tax=Salarchaeum sp. III TaxID=3107927 RepID=UPI002ED8AA1E